MKVPSFNEFISEAVENPKLVIITDEPEQQKLFTRQIDFNKKRKS